MISKFKEIVQKLNNIKVTENAPMSKYTSFIAGGAAAFLVEVETVDALKEVLKIVDEK